MSENEFQTQGLPAAPGMSRVQKLALGAGLIAVPLGAAFFYAHLKESERRADKAMEEGANYDVSALRQVDPALIKYHETGRIETGMRQPRAIAVDAQGRLLVAGDQMIRVMSRRGERIADLSLEGDPVAVAGSPDGTIFVGLKDHVEVYGADGKRKSVWPAFGKGSQLTCIAVIGGEVYVADAGRRVVQRCGFDGKVLGELGRADESRGVRGLVVPSAHLDVAGGANGRIWISNPGRHSLESYTPDGEMQSFWGKLGVTVDAFFGCCNPSDFAVLSDGRIVTAEKGVPRVKVYAPDGQLQAVVASPDSFGGNMTGLDLAVDPSDHILVLEPGTSAVRVFVSNEKGAG